MFHDQGSAEIMMVHSTDPVYVTSNVQVLARLFTMVRGEMPQRPVTSAKSETRVMC